MPVFMFVREAEVEALRSQGVMVTKGRDRETRAVTYYKALHHDCVVRDLYSPHGDDIVWYAVWWSPERGRPFMCRYIDSDPDSDGNRCVVDAPPETAALYQAWLVGPRKDKVREERELQMRLLLHEASTPYKGRRVKVVGRCSAPLGVVGEVISLVRQPESLGWNVVFDGPTGRTYTVDAEKVKVLNWTENAPKEFRRDLLVLNNGQ